MTTIDDFTSGTAAAATVVDYSLCAGIEVVGAARDVLLREDLVVRDGGAA